MYRLLLSHARCFFLLVGCLTALAGCTHHQLKDDTTQVKPASVSNKPQVLLVTVDQSTSENLEKLQASIQKDYGLSSKNAWPLVSLAIHCFIYQIPAELDTRQLINAMEQDSRIDSAQLIREYATLDQPYDDQHFSLQYGMKSIQAVQAHQWSTGKGIKVGVVDTGIDINHSDLNDSVGYTRNFVGKTSDKVFAENHGTAIAGIIAARANNGQGIVGIAPEAEVIGLRGCWQSEGTTQGNCNSLSLAKAIDYANIHAIGILNLSLQGPHDPIIERLLNYAIAHGTVIVTAFKPSDHIFPASQRGVIAVVAQNDSEFSTPAQFHLESTLLAAPGTDILTTVPEGQYDLLQGSSLAAAHVSGVVALLRQQQPGLAPGKITELLTNTSTVSHNGGGQKKVNACLAVAELLGKKCL